jgi:hypothetical protein
LAAAPTRRFTLVVVKFRKHYVIRLERVRRLLTGRYWHLDGWVFPPPRLENLSNPRILFLGAWIGDRGQCQGQQSQSWMTCDGFASPMAELKAWVRQRSLSEVQIGTYPDRTKTRHGHVSAARYAVAWAAYPICSPQPHLPVACTNNVLVRVDGREPGVGAEAPRPTEASMLTRAESISITTSTHTLPHTHRPHSPLHASQLDHQSRLLPQAQHLLVGHPAIALVD